MKEEYRRANNGVQLVKEQRMRKVIETSEKEEGQKHRKVEVMRKWWVLAHPPYSRQGNGRQLPKVETDGG